jgi:hypothetical protein
MIEKIKITTIDIKHGTSKNGRAYAMPIIQTEDGRKMSMYIDREYDTKKGYLEKIQAWEAGDEKEVIVEKNGDFLNFYLPSRTDLLETRVFEVEGKVEKINTVLKKYMEKK